MYFDRIYVTRGRRGREEGSRLSRVGNESFISAVMQLCAHAHEIPPRAYSRYFSRRLLRGREINLRIAAS